MATREQLIEDFADHKYATGEKFARLINSMKLVQEPVESPAESGTSNSFIDSISQGADGKITATKKSVVLNYAQIQDKPTINGVTLMGDKTPAQLGLATANQVEVVSNKVDKLPSGYYYGKFNSVEDLPEATEKGYAYVASSDPTVFYTYLVSGAGAEWVDSGNKMVNTVDITTPKTSETELSKEEKYYASANVSDRSAVVVAETGIVKSLGYRVLSPNLSFAEQVATANTIYEVKDEFNLNNGSVTIPANCTLKFNGGKLKNGTLSGQNSKIISDLNHIFTDITIIGTWDVPNAYPEWFGAKVYTESTDAIQSCINGFKTTIINGTFYVNKPIRITGAKNVIGKNVGTTDSSSALRVNNSFTSITETVSGESITISSIFYGYAAGDYLRIENIFITGRYKTENCIGIRKGSFHVVVRNCYLMEFYGAAICLTGSDKAIVEKCLLYYNFIAIYGSGKYNPSYLTNPFGYEDSYARSGQPNDILVKDCHISSNQFGIIFLGSSNVTIQNNLIGYTSAQPVSVLYTRTANIDGNYFEGDYGLQFKITKNGERPPSTIAMHGNTNVDADVVTMAKNCSIYRGYITCVSTNANVGITHIGTFFLRNYQGNATAFSDSVNGIDAVVVAQDSDITMAEPGINEHTEINNVLRKTKYHLIFSGGNIYCSFNANIYNASKSILPGIVKSNAPKVIVPSDRGTTYYYVNTAASPSEVSINWAQSITDAKEVNNIIFKKYTSIGYSALKLAMSSFLNKKLTYKASVKILSSTDASVTPTMQIFTDMRTKYLCNGSKGAISLKAGRPEELTAIFDLDGISATNLYFQLSNLSNDIYTSEWSITSLIDDITYPSLTKSSGSYLPNMGTINPVIRWNTTVNKFIIWDGVNSWRFFDGSVCAAYTSTSTGFKQPRKKQGTDRPTLTSSDAGYIFYDTTLNKYINWNGSAWVDANGEPVGLQVSDTSVLIGAAADSSVTLNVYHANALTVSALNPDNTPATSWLTVPSTIAVGTNTLTISAAANTASNPRGAKVIISDGTDVVIVNVVQNYSTN